VEKLSPGIPTNLSPDLLHPCLIDDAEGSDRVLMWNRAAMLAALVVGSPAIGAGLVVVGIVARVRAWRGGRS
jgi:hypothetical protein